MNKIFLILSIGFTVLSFAKNAVFASNLPACPPLGDENQKKNCTYVSSSEFENVEKWADNDFPHYKKLTQNNTKNTMSSSAKNEAFQKGKRAYEREDYLTALDIWSSLADQGHPRAANGVGLLYQNGLGVQKSLKTAAGYFKISAKLGSARGQVNLALAYAFGNGVPQNCEAAMKFYDLSANQGNVDAKSQLGALYFFGKCVPVNYPKAEELLQFSANLGDAHAQQLLAKIYMKGKSGVPQDKKKALRLTRRSAEQGDSNGQELLASFYALGHGVPEDYVYAYMWSNLAANQTAAGTKIKDIVSRGMTAKQIAEAQKLGRECVKKNYKNCERKMN